LSQDNAEHTKTDALTGTKTAETPTTFTNTSASPAKVEPSKYTGGEVRVPGGGNTHIALAFEGVAAKEQKDSVALAVLARLLGGGARVSRDGPGVGLQSRLHANFVTQNSTVENALTFNLPYSDSGLFGVYAQVSGNIAGAVDGIVSEISKVLSGIDEAEVTRAKLLLQTDLLTASRVDDLHFLGQQVLSGATAVVTPEAYAKNVDAVTAGDVSRIARRVFGSRPTLAVVGDVSSVPSAESVRSLLAKHAQQK